jgi:hypothetical protein
MDELSKKARRLGGALEPIAGSVYFSPECHTNYEKLGFGPSPGEFAGVAGPEFSAYFCSRGAPMGQVPGEVVAMAFGVFNPEIVLPAVDAGWEKTDANTIREARDDGAIGQLTRVLGEKPDGIDRAIELLTRAVAVCRPEGKALYSGLASLDLPGDPVGDMWRQADRLREYRGDAHIAAWTGACLDATEICLLTDAYWGLPLRTYSASRGWTPAQFDAAEERLVSRGLLKAQPERLPERGESAFTDAGRAYREEVEVATDRMCKPLVDALGDDFEELLSILHPWGAAIRDAKGYPAGGPHDAALRED